MPSHRAPGGPHESGLLEVQEHVPDQGSGDQVLGFGFDMIYSQYFGHNLWTWVPYEGLSGTIATRGTLCTPLRVL